MEMINNIKMPFLSRVGFTLSSIGYLYQNGGFKQVFAYIKNVIKVNISRFRYKHCKSYRNKILSNLNADNIGFMFILEGFLYGNIGKMNMGKYLKYLSEEEKEKYKKRTLELRESMIKQYGDKNIEAFDVMWGLDVLCKDDKPKKVYKRKKKSNDS